MKLKNILYFGVFSSVLCSSTYATSLSNFNEKNTQKLIQAFQQKDVHIVYFGDSHTAADEMTHVIRLQLQQRLGNGGMGWGMPMYFSGQRMARFGYDKIGWTPISSRVQREANYTIGGMNAVPQYNGARLTIKAKQADESTQKIQVSLRQSPSDDKFTGIDAQGRHFSLEAPIKNNTWQLVEFTAKLPFTITAHQTSNSAIGGWWARNSNSQGAVLSPIGINGAELAHWSRWNSSWPKELAQIAPELVVLAYGTNEAFNTRLEVAEARQILVNQIQKIRAASPNTAIMIVSAPESLTNLSGECGTRPQSLTALQRMQYQVAQEQKTLFWDWQKAMGGSCSMKRWIGQGKALKDGVHFSVAGYQQLGKKLAHDLLSLAQVSIQDSPFHDQSADENRISLKNNSVSTGYAEICLEGQQECKSIRF